MSKKGHECIPPKCCAHSRNTLRALFGTNPPCVHSWHWLKGPRCGSGPNCPLQAPPPQGSWRTLPSAQPLPPCPPYLFPHPPPRTFCNAREVRPELAWGRRRTGGGGGGRSKRHLGADPHLGALELEEPNLFPLNVVFSEWRKQTLCNTSHANPVEMRNFDSVTNLMCCIFPILKPLTCGRQSGCLGWIYRLPGGQKFSFKLSSLSVGLHREDL